MESEDEEAEENGEDLDRKDAENEEDEDMNSEEEEGKAGFIVSDGHLSVCEYEFDDENEPDEKKKLQDIQIRRERLKQMKEDQAQAAGKVYVVTSDTDSGLLTQYSIRPLSSMSFPLCLKKPEKVYDVGQGDPNAILKYRMELIYMCYSSLEAKTVIVDDFNAKYPECSKKSIERVFKEIIVKEKRENDLRAVWYATEQILLDLVELSSPSNKEYLASLATERMKPLVEEAEELEKTRLEEQALRDEIKRLEQAQKAAERAAKEKEKMIEKEKLQAQKDQERKEKEELKEQERLQKEAEKQKEKEAKEAQRKAENEQKEKEK